MTPRELWARIVSLLRRRELDRDFEDEIAAHLELARAENLRRGLDPEEARRLAAVRFGSITSAKEAVWEQQSLPGAGAFLQDARYALRVMRQSQGFTLVTVLTLAFGIGLCSVMFSILNGFVLQPLPGVPDAGRLVTLQAPVAYPYFESYRDHSGVASSTAAFIGPVPFDVAMDADTPAERIMGHIVSPEYFPTLGVQPLLGRFFDPALDRPGAAPTVVVTELFWRTHLNSDPHAIGGTLRVNGQPTTIIGIGPKDFTGVFPIPKPASIFVPVTAGPKLARELDDDALHRTTRPVFRLLMRLAPGVAAAGAEARLDAETRQLDRQSGKNDREKKGRLVRLMSAGGVALLPPEARQMILFFYVLLVTLVLSLTCANLAGLILARGVARAREIAVRVAIGASRLRLVRQFMTESVILAALGGAAGLAAAYGFFQLLPRFQSAGTTPSSVHWGPDLRVALFTFAISALAGAGFGLMPALAVTRPDLMSVLKAGLQIRFGRHRRFGLRNLFVVYQVAAAMTLIMIMGFTVIALRFGTSRDPGFDPSPVSLFSLDPLRDGYTPAQAAALLAALPAKLERVAGVESVSLAAQPPLNDLFPNTRVNVGNAVHTVVLQKIGPRFFATLGVPILRGVEFDAREVRQTESVPALINQTAARELFGGADPVGRRIRRGESTFQVIGVARYDRPVALMNRPVATIFLPLIARDLSEPAADGITVLVRSRPGVDLQSIRHEVAAIDGKLTVFNQKTMRQHLAELDLGNQVATATYLPIGIFGLILACLGLAGVTAQAAEQRRKEIGIRMALGARRTQLLRLIMREGTVMVSVGAIAGLAGAYAVARILSAAYAPMAEFIGMGSGNPALLIGVPSLLISLAAIACYLPARRSATVDPLIALREE